KDENGLQLLGDCLWIDNNDSPREFHIRINSTLRKKRQLMALAHELVHMKQFAKNEMRDMIRGPLVSWNTKWKKDYVNEKKIHYYDLPWEIEAHGREYGMYVRYLDHLKADKVVL